MSRSLAMKGVITKSRVAFVVWFLIWASTLLVGIQLYLGVVAQKVPGYPKPGQLDVYVLFPCALVMANILLIIFQRKLPLLLRLIAFFMQFFVLPVYIFFGSGGI